MTNVPNQVRKQVASRTVCPSWPQTEKMEMTVDDRSIVDIRLIWNRMVRGKISIGIRIRFVLDFAFKVIFTFAFSLTYSGLEGTSNGTLQEETEAHGMKHRSRGKGSRKRIRCGDCGESN